MLKLKVYLTTAAFVSGLAIGGGLVNEIKKSQINKMELDYLNSALEAEQKHTESMIERNERLNELRAELAETEAKFYEDLTKAEQSSSVIQSELRSANQRLSVRANCPAPDSGVSSSGEAGSLDDAAGTRAVLHGDDAAAIIRITGQADQCRIKLSGLQEHMLKLTEEQGVPK